MFALRLARSLVQPCYNRTMGKLYVVGTPIGNLEDITLRALRVLREADLVAAEDTRRTRKLLAYYNIQSRLFSYRRENETRAAAELADRIEDGLNIALVSDAGMPGISDPGFALVEQCARRGLDVEVIPGPSSLTALLAISGVPLASFVFEGYLPNKRSARRARLLDLAGEKRPVVFFEAPHRIRPAIEDMVELLPTHFIVLARELTKVHEEIRRGTAGELLEQMGVEPGRGEYLGLIIAGEETESTIPAPEKLAREVQGLLAQGVARNDAFKMTATRWGIPKRTVYDAFLRHG